jgi:hypothetical protein
MVNFSTLKKEAICSLATWIDIKLTRRRDISEDIKLLKTRCKNLEMKIYFKCISLSEACEDDRTEGLTTFKHIFVSKFLAAPRKDGGVGRGEITLETLFVLEGRSLILESQQIQLN